MSFARTISRNGAVFPHSADNETASPVKQLKEAGNARGEEEHFQKKKKGQQVQTVRLGAGGCPPCRKSKPCSPSGAEGRPGKPQHKPREAAGGSVEGHVLLLLVLWEPLEVLSTQWHSSQPNRPGHRHEERVKAREEARGQVRRLQQPGGTGEVGPSRG